MDISGQWDCVMKTPLGAHQISLSVASEGQSFTGQAESEFGPLTILGGRIEGNHLKWSARIQIPVEIGLEFDVIVDDDTLAGEAKSMMFGSFPVNGKRRT